MWWTFSWRKRGLEIKQHFVRGSPLLVSNCWWVPRNSFQLTSRNPSGCIWFYWSDYFWIGLDLPLWASWNPLGGVEPWCLWILHSGWAGQQTASPSPRVFGGYLATMRIASLLRLAKRSKLSYQQPRFSVTPRPGACFRQCWIWYPVRCSSRPDRIT